jgi:Mn2+/Fe2+ NRAMP family transporter
VVAQPILTRGAKKGFTMRALRWLTRVGPAFVIAAVVLGPGSVTTMTKMGAAQGYAMVWVPVLAGVLMASFVALFMRFGISSKKSYLQHCADTWGRWFAALCGFSIFYIATAFQFGNNIGVATAMNSLITPAERLGPGAEPPVPAWLWPVVFNALALAFLFGLRRIYHVLERMMTALVAVMLVAFFINLLFARPDWSGVARGLVPSLPEGLDWAVLAGMVATTFSIAGAIFQTYLVRARGWTQRDYGKGMADSVSGIAMLALISMVVMVTSAAVLHGQGVEVKNAADMAVQLQASLGGLAKVVFCIGFACAAFSSFLVNAMIGGTLLSDGFGLSEDINSMPVKVASAASLVIGMVVAILVTHTGAVDFADALVAAQAGTLLAIPLAILSALLVLFYPRGSEARPLGPVAKALVVLGTLVLIAIAVRSYSSTLGKLRKMLGGTSAVSAPARHPQREGARPG